MNRKVRTTLLFSLLIMFLFVPMSQANAGLIISIPDLCNEPNGDWALMENEFVNGAYVTFGEEDGYCVMTVPEAPTAQGSAFAFYLAAYNIADVVELKADLMLSANDDNSNLLVEVQRTLPDGTAVEIRGYILSSGGQAFIQGLIHYWDMNGNPHSFALEERPALFDHYYGFEIVADGDVVTISVDGTVLVSWNYDYDVLGQWVGGSATIAGGSDTSIFYCKVKNVQAKYYPEVPFDILIYVVQKYILKKGTENSLVKKIESARDSYENGKNGYIRICEQVKL